MIQNNRIYRRNTALVTLVLCENEIKSPNEYIKTFIQNIFAYFKNKNVPNEALICEFGHKCVKSVPNYCRLLQWRNGMESLPIVSPTIFTTGLTIVSAMVNCVEYRLIQR